MTTRAPTSWAAGAALAVALSAAPVAVAAETPPVPSPAVSTPAPTVPAKCDVNAVLLEAPSKPLQKLSATAAHQRATGQGVVVAVVDSGVFAGNPQLPADALLPGRSFVGKPADRGQVDTFGHGTAIAGLIAARPVTGSGVLGLAPGARILPVRVFAGTQATGNVVADAQLPDIQRLATGIRWAADQGAKVINVSISVAQDVPALRAAIRYAQSKNALIVASAGNRTNQANPSDPSLLLDGPRYPAAYKNVLGVTAAVTTSGQVTDASVHGPHVDVAAPGSDVLTTVYGGNCLLAPPSNPSTSFATGYASATAALLREAFPAESANRIGQRLMWSASLNSLGKRDDVSGWGVIQPVNALTDVVVRPALPAAPASAAAAPRATEVQAVGERLSLAGAASVDPYGDAKDQSALWLIVGAAGLALLGLIGLLPAVRRHRE